MEDPFQRSSIDRQFAILLARYFFMYRPSSKLSGKPRIVRRSVASTPSLPPRVSAQVRGCCIGAPSSPLAQLEKEGTKRRDERFPLFIHRARLERSRRKRETTRNLEFRIIQLGIKRVSETNRDPKNSRASHAGGKEEGRKEEGKIKEEGSGREFCRRFEKLPTIPRSRGVERN